MRGVIVATRTQSPGIGTWALVKQAQAGSPEAFGQLYDQCNATVFHFFELRVDNPQLAEEYTEKTFLWALRNISSLNRQAWSTPLVWLLWRARSLAADGFVPEYPSGLELEDPTCGVRIPITQLPFQLQECIVFRLFMRLEPTEIAQIMECTTDDLTQMGQQIDSRLDELAD